MPANPYESPAPGSPPASDASRNRVAAIATALCAATLFVVGVFPGLLTYAFASMADPALEGADRTREIASKAFHDVVSNSIFAGYLLAMCGLLCAVLVFAFVAILSVPSIRRAWQLVLVFGACSALWIYGYFFVCAFGLVDSYFIK